MASDLDIFTLTLSDPATPEALRAFRSDVVRALEAGAKALLVDIDSVSHVMGAFDKFFVVDTHLHYQVASFLAADVGVDNLLDEKYFEYHPFPGRTYIASARLVF